ncbi:MAG: MoaD/ThiS family protein [Pseudomonadota bacterium]|nr:MoaD/ThiS family protein [Pseudomonadota bacterium]
MRPIDAIMANVIINREIARQYTNGQTEIEVTSDNIRAVIRELDERFPGVGEVLRTDMAVAIDGEIYQNVLLEPVRPNSEVAFLPAIEGG